MPIMYGSINIYIYFWLSYKYILYNYIKYYFFMQKQSWPIESCSPKAKTKIWPLKMSYNNRNYRPLKT